MDPDGVAVAHPSFSTIRFFNQGVQLMKYLSILLGSLALCACSGPDVRLPEPGRPFTEDEVYPAASPREALWSETVEHGASTVVFSELLGGAGVMMGMTSPSAEGSPLEALSEGARYRPTPAEVWLALTGRPESELPALLRQDHEYFTQLDGRAAEGYQHLSFEGEERKAVVLNSLYPNNFVGFPGKCWAHSKTEQHNVFQPSFGVLYTCTSRIADSLFGAVFNGTITDVNSCSSANPIPANEFGIVSAYFDPRDPQGVLIPSGGRLNVRTGEAALVQGSPVIWHVNSGFRVPALFAPNTYTTFVLRPQTNYKMALEVQNTGASPIAVVTFGTSITQTGLPSFGSTRCP